MNKTLSPTQKITFSAMLIALAVLSTFIAKTINMLNYPMFTPENYVDPVNTYIYNLLRHYHISRRLAMKWVQNFNRDGARIPMQWSSAPQAGFSTAKTTWLPVHPQYPSINVEVEKQDPSSILNFYKKILAFRKQDPILCYGDFGAMATPKPIMKVTLRGNGFMTYMVRILVGVAFKVAMGKMTLDEVRALLTPLERKIISFKAPPEGLCLEEVIYV